MYFFSAFEVVILISIISVPHENSKVFVKTGSLGYPGFVMKEFPSFKLIFIYSSFSLIIGGENLWLVKEKWVIQKTRKMEN